MLVHNLGTQLRIFLATGRCCCHTNLSCISIGDLLSKQQARFTHGFIIQSVSHVCLLLNQVICPPVFLSSLDCRMQRIATPGSKTLVCKSIFAIFKSPLQASNKDFNTSQWCNPLHWCCVYNPVICSLQCVILLPLLLGIWRETVIFNLWWYSTIASRIWRETATKVFSFWNCAKIAETVPEWTNLRLFFHASWFSESSSKLQQW